MEWEDRHVDMGDGYGPDEEDVGAPHVLYARQVCGGPAEQFPDNVTVLREGIVAAVRCFASVPPALHFDR
jgi:hypothetical protein